MEKCNGRLLVAWYLTNDDDSGDGKKLDYLKEIEKEEKEFIKNR